MSRLARFGARGAVAVVGGTVMVSGLVFAFQGESAVTRESALAKFSEGPPSRPTTVETTADAGVPTATATSVPTELPPEQPDGSAVAGEVATVTPRPMTQVVAPPPTSPAPITDLPKYTDLAVLGLAADARLPSGRTFRECVELPPSHEKWPTPVHLYYEGKGKWLVETHVSEVQVVFDEATASFSTRNFAPTSPDCAKSP